MNPEGFVTYLILLIWGPIGVSLFVALCFALFISWATKRFL